MVCFYWYQENCPLKIAPQKITPQVIAPQKISPYENTPYEYSLLWKLPSENYLPAFFPR